MKRKTHEKKYDIDKWLDDKTREFSGKSQFDCSVEDLLNGLYHMADDHRCCEGTIALAGKIIRKLQDDLDRAQSTIGEIFEQAPIDIVWQAKNKTTRDRWLAQAGQYKPNKQYEPRGSKEY